MTCPLCGFKFSEFNDVCVKCPITFGCDLKCCPNCNYQFPKESKLVRALNKLFSKETLHGTKRN